MTKLRVCCPVLLWTRLGGRLVYIYMRVREKCEIERKNFFIKLFIYLALDCKRWPLFDASCRTSRCCSSSVSVLCASSRVLNCGTQRVSLPHQCLPSIPEILKYTTFSEVYFRTVRQHIYLHRVKGKAVPVETQIGLEGSRMLSLTAFSDNRHMKLVRLSALRTGRLYPPG